MAAYAPAADLADWYRRGVRHLNFNPGMYTRATIDQAFKDRVARITTTDELIECATLTGFAFEWIDSKSDAPATPENSLSAYRLRSPLHRIGKYPPSRSEYVSDRVKFLLIHGQRDEAVPPSNSEKLRRAIAADGLDVRYETLPGGHIPERLDALKLIKLIDSFLSRGK